MHNQHLAHAGHGAPLRYNPHVYNHNPLSRGAKIAIGVGVAAALGVATFMLWPRQASAAPVLPPPGTGGGGGGGGAATGGAKVNAPPFPMPEANARALEASMGAAEHAQWLAAVGEAMQAHGNGGPNPTAQDIAAARSALGIPGNRPVADWLTDQAYKKLYPDARQIPGEASRGTGWQPYIDSWFRMRNMIRDMPWVQ